MVLVSTNTVRAIRSELRDREFKKWAAMPQRGIGVKWYKSTPFTNSWVSNKGGLTSSEWTNGIKLSMNLMSNRGTGGRSQGNRLCRNPTCGEKNQIETIPHIRGSCPKSELLRNSAHHKIRSAVASIFRCKGWEVHEEIHCRSQDDEGGEQNRRADIVVIDRTQDRAMIIDPTLRWESNADSLDIDIDREKKSIYEPTVPYFREKYGVTNWEVHGLWFGVRGTASPLLRGFFKRFQIANTTLAELCLTVLRDTLHIIHRHLYS
ncbi:Hypothetical protein NTJ_08758 [Nesidiocoris tenuis]|uniref:Reverse transcriptase domain-containing protein n=1 Tax=Nesidiocoris tenuis TaxID=355587 RepID=A0ABN7AUT4_9HEMI|nr:Hypothetical protein NTJ_08758 [Nesidiocoris tenuis]